MEMRSLRGIRYGRMGSLGRSFLSFFYFFYFLFLFFFLKKILYLHIMTAKPALNLIRPLVPAARASSSGLWWPHLPSPHHRRIIHLFRQQTNFRNSGMFFSRTIRHFSSSSTFSSSSPSPSSSGAVVVVAAAQILTVSPNPPVRLPLRSSSIAQTRIRFSSIKTNKNEKKNSNNMSSTGIKQISTDKAMKRKSYFPFFSLLLFPHSFHVEGGQRAFIPMDTFHAL